MLLSKGQNPDGSLRLPQVVVDADQGFYCCLRAALVLVLFVMQGLCKCMALLGQGTKGPARAHNSWEPMRCDRIVLL